MVVVLVVAVIAPIVGGVLVLIFGDRSKSPLEYTARIVGLPGEVWAERRGFVYINGRRLSEPYVDPADRDSRTLSMRDVPPRGKFVRIPEGAYLLMGDNRAFFADSRRCGLRRAAALSRVVEVDNHAGWKRLKPPFGVRPPS